MANEPWKESLAQSFEQLQADAREAVRKRENLQPLQLGKGNPYANIFKVGDRVRPELALKTERPDGEIVGSGEVDLADLIPEQALKDFSSSLAAANVGAFAEAREGVRETVTYDADEAEQLEWTGHPDRHLLQPHVVERAAAEPESAAYEGVEDEEIGQK